MKRISVKTAIIAGLFSAALAFTSCKNKEKETTTAPPTTVDTSTVPAPVEVATDDALKTSVTDATKDYPGVSATVENGEITLTGNISRDQLPKLMQALNALHPRKINNKLTIK